MDPYLVIARLKRQIVQLRAELAIARGEGEQNMDEALPEYELERYQVSSGYLILSNFTFIDASKQ
jgi:kinesin family protein 6/9